MSSSPVIHFQLRLHEPLIISVLPDNLVLKPNFQFIRNISIHETKKTYDPFVERERVKIHVDREQLKKQMKQWMNETNQIQIQIQL